LLAVKKNRLSPDRSTEASGFDSDFFTAHARSAIEGFDKSSDIAFRTPRPRSGCLGPYLSPGPKNELLAAREAHAVRDVLIAQRFL
jgi:hypothetical protein